MWFAICSLDNNICFKNMSFSWLNTCLLNLPSFKPKPDLIILSSKKSLKKIWPSFSEYLPSISFIADLANEAISLYFLSLWARAILSICVFSNLDCKASILIALGKSLLITCLAFNTCPTRLVLLSLALNLIDCFALMFNSFLKVLLFFKCLS